MHRGIQRFQLKRKLDSIYHSGSHRQCAVLVSSSVWFWGAGRSLRYSAFLEFWGLFSQKDSQWMSSITPYFTSCFERRSSRLHRLRSALRAPLAQRSSLVPRIRFLWALLPGDMALGSAILSRRGLWRPLTGALDRGSTIRFLGQSLRNRIFCCTLRDSFLLYIP